MPKLSDITQSSGSPITTDSFVGVSASKVDERFTLQQIINALPVSRLGLINVKDFGADGNDRLYNNIVGGSGYTGGSASNLVSNPEDFTQWTAGNVTVTSNAVADPRGNLLADAITETNAATTFHAITSATSSAFSSNATTTYDVEIKPNNRTWILLEMYDSGSAVMMCTFNLTGNGVVGSSFVTGGASISTVSITPLSNGFFRCSMTGSIGGSTTVNVQVQSLLGDMIYFDSASDPNQFFTGTSSLPAFYLGLARLYAIATYQGSTFISGDSVFAGVALTGGSGTGARANIVVSLGQVLSVTSYCPGSGYVVGDTLSCAAADIGGTGSGFTCQVATVGNDSSAIQAAIDSGNGNLVTVYFPPGTYNVFPPDNRGSDCLMMRHSNVRLLGAGRKESIVQFFVSGGRHPETSYDVPATGGNAGFVWRGRGFQIKQNTQNLEWRSLRLTGLCKRHNNRWPLGGSDPAVLSGGNTLGTFGDGDGWDESHQCIARYNRTTSVDRNLRVIDCELDSWKGEIIGSIGDFTTPVNDSVSQWTWWIENNYIHDTLADCISSSGNAMIMGNEIAWGTNGIEEGTATCHTVFRNNHIHDHTHGVTIVVGTDTGAASTCTGQQIVNNNFFERCYLNGVFVFQFQTNADVSDNVFVDCGVTGSVTGGAIVVSLLSGSQPIANVYVRRNLIYNHLRNVQQAIGVSMSLFTGSFLRGVYIEDNKLSLTPQAQLSGNVWSSPFGSNIASGCTIEFSRNDFRVATEHYVDAGGGGQLLLGHGNILNSQINFPEMTAGTLTMTSNTTLTDIPNMSQTLTDSNGVWLEAFLMISATAGGAKVAVVSTGSVGAMNYDVEMWAGTTIDAASGKSSSSGTVFASAASITKIRISGYCAINTGSTGNIKIQFAQNSSNTTASSVNLGSWFRCRNNGS